MTKTGLFIKRARITWASRPKYPFKAVADSRQLRQQGCRIYDISQVCLIKALREDSNIMSTLSAFTPCVRQYDLSRHALEWLMYIIGLIALTIFSPCFAQSGDLLLQKANLVYQGAFRLPQIPCVAPTYGCFNYGGTAIGFNPANNSLFIVGHPYGQLTAEVSIPAVVDSSDINGLNTSTVLQPFADSTAGARNQVNPSTVNPNQIGGQLVYGGRLIVSVYSYYDGAGTQRSSHFVRPLDLSVNGQVLGPYKVGPLYSGFVSGYMTPIPMDWQSAFGGPAFTGNCCLAITSLQSNGPAVSVFDPAALGAQNPTPATLVLGYPHSTPLGPGYSTQNGLFNGTTQISGLVFPTGTRSVLFVGRQGTGPFCYGSGTSTQALAGTPTGHGTDIWCYDLASPNKGVHAFPYIYQVWAYDANDLLAVKNGSKSSYSVQPYATWSFSLPFQNPNDSHLLGGAAYDPAHNLLYISQLSEDTNSNPVIHVFKVDTSVKVPQPPSSMQAN